MVAKVNTRQIGLSLGHGQAEYLEQCAEATGKPLSALVRWALSQAVPGFSQLPDPPQSHRSRRSTRRRKSNTAMTATAAALALAELRGSDD